MAISLTHQGKSYLILRGRGFKSRCLLRLRLTSSAPSLSDNFLSDPQHFLSENLDTFTCDVHSIKGVFSLKRQLQLQRRNAHINLRQLLSTHCFPTPRSIDRIVFPSIFDSSNIGLGACAGKLCRQGCAPKTFPLPC